MQQGTAIRDGAVLPMRSNRRAISAPLKWKGWRQVILIKNTLDINFKAPQCGRLEGKMPGSLFSRVVIMPYFLRQSRWCEFHHVLASC